MFEAEDCGYTHRAGGPAHGLGCLEMRGGPRNDEHR